MGPSVADAGGLTNEACLDARREGERLGNLAYRDVSLKCSSKDDCTLVASRCEDSCSKRAIPRSEVAAFQRNEASARTACDVYWSAECIVIAPRAVADCSGPQAFCEAGRCTVAPYGVYFEGTRLLMREPFVFVANEPAPTMARMLDDIAIHARRAPHRRLRIVVAQEQEPEALALEQAKRQHREAVDLANARAAALVRALVKRSVPAAQVIEAKYGVVKERVAIFFDEVKP